MITVDIASRLRQAIEIKDLPLVKRILKNNPTYLQNPDYSNKSNTSLHLAAQYGLADIAEHLLSLGHDAKQPASDDYFYAVNNLGTSFNTDGHTALHLAASHSHTAVVSLLCSNFPKIVNHPDNEGCTALHLASRAHPPPTSTPAPKMSQRPPEDTSTIEVLLQHSDVHAQDLKGNTCLHYATAWGNLKTVRALIQAGADPLCANNDGWTPEYYSVTVQAEVYFRNLVAEYEKRRAEESVRIKERRGRRGPGVRLVARDDDGESEGTDEDGGRRRAESVESSVESGGLGISMGRTESWK